MLHDLFPHCNLTVSDIRESILANLHNRFRQAGITQFKSFIADLTIRPASVPHAPFDMILADVPCTGSGTWARTPEAMYYFEEKSVANYQHRQLQIIENTIPYLKGGGFFVYITCSVFRAENEEVINQLQQNHGLILTHQQLIPGYHLEADTLFFALLQKR